MGIEITIDNEIGWENYDLMWSLEDGGMAECAGAESAGGNAFHINGTSCMCVNFYYDGETGKIDYFGNDVSTERRNGHAEGNFRIAYGVIPTPVFEIVETNLDDSTSEQARRTIEFCKRLYNYFSAKKARKHQKDLSLCEV